MKNIHLRYCVISLLSSILTLSCISNNKESTKVEINDKASYEYLSFNEVVIGKQVWMSENLNLGKFRNGDNIPEAKTANEWIKSIVNKQPAWCYYDNDSTKGKKYGKLYNYYAVIDPRCLAPAGWRIPSDVEWTVLTDYLGGEDIAGKKMKSINDWYTSNDEVVGTNESGFSALPGGDRCSNTRINDSNSTFNGFFYYGGWWSSTKSDLGELWMRCLIHGFDNVSRYESTLINKNGLSVRCLRD
jgi:uncharacterized protein (TIGR02145 family)